MICFNCNDCCTKESPCGEGSGGCDWGLCKEGLKCGTNNCRDMHGGDERIDPEMGCCFKPAHVEKCDPFENEKECCTEESPCGKGSGDCDGDEDCKEGLKCGKNNCRSFNGGFEGIDWDLDCCY